MKLLLLGGTGQIGWELQRSLAPLGLSAADVRRVDLTEPERLRTCLRELAPEVIVNAAGYTDVDRAEAQPDLAHQINAVAPALKFFIAYPTNFGVVAQLVERLLCKQDVASSNLADSTKLAKTSTGHRHFLQSRAHSSVG